VDSGPLPPHERTWRHPSELAAEQRALLRAEGAAPSARAFALVTGTLGLLAVGALLLTVTPPRQDSPIALSASTTLAALGTPELRASTTATPVGPTGALANPDRSSTGLHALVTPIGDGRYGLVTSAALAGHAGATLSVRFTSGRIGVVEVVERAADELVLVALPAGETGHPIADDPPADDEIVTVLASPPITVPYAEVKTLQVQEGTPVFDEEGALVGLCSRGVNGVLVIEPPDDLAAGHPSSTTPTTVATSTTVTSLPTTTLAPTTTLVASTTTTVPESSSTVTTVEGVSTTSTLVAEPPELSGRD
jgi:hypothetical protein